MRVNILGCSGGIGEGLRTTCIQVDDDILIDSGTGAAEMPLAEMARIRHVFITHTHLDHLASLPLLIDTVFDQLKAEPMIVHAQPHSIEVIKKHIFNWHIWPDFSVLPDEQNPVIRFVPMSPGEIVNINNRSIQMVEVNHTVPGVGYIVENGSSTFAFSGDTTTNSGLWDALNQRKQLDLFIIECAFPDSEFELAQESKHYCPKTLAEDFAKLKHNNVQACITHLKPGSERQIMDDLANRLPGQPLLRLHGGEIFEL